MFAGALIEADVRFSKHRLDVVRQWPDSALKRATMAAIENRLQRFEEGRIRNAGRARYGELILIPDARYKKAS